MRSLIIFLFLLVFLGTSFAQDKPVQNGNKTYHIETKHTKEQCLAALDALNNDKYRELLSEVEWGCMSGNHTGYLTVEASSEEDALSRLPEESRKDAKAYEVAKFTPEQIESWHQK